jgi:hypothetical protein
MLILTIRLLLLDGEMMRHQDLIGLSGIALDIIGAKMEISKSQEVRMTLALKKKLVLMSQGYATRAKQANAKL